MTLSDPTDELVEALKLGREWTEWVAVQCGHRDCTPENCTSKMAAEDLAKIDAAISAMQADFPVRSYKDATDRVVKE
jgi:hypothetical protein